MRKLMEPLADRIKRLSRVDATGCWIWQRRLGNSGYGQLTIHVPGGKPKTVLAHRTSYEEHIGPIPTGLQLDHLCRVRSCVNPAHLEPVTARENIMRSSVHVAAAHAAKTHCANGHEFTEANTRCVTGEGGRQTRVCRACQAANTQRYRLKRAAAHTAVADPAVTV